MTGIYCITNKINGKKYIGQSTNIIARFKAHKYHSHNKKLRDDIIKYGINNFDFNVIELCQKEELDKKERYYIDKYNAIKNGYNVIGDTVIPVNKKDNNYCYYIVGKNIKKYRKKKKLTQEQLATICSLSVGFISDLESDTFRTISLDTMCLIAKKLEIHPKQLLEDLV